MKTKSRETQEIVYESETTANKTQQYARKNLEKLFADNRKKVSDHFELVVKDGKYLKDRRRELQRRQIIEIENKLDYLFGLYIKIKAKVRHDKKMLTNVAEDLCEYSKYAVDESSRVLWNGPIEWDGYSFYNNYIVRSEESVKAEEIEKNFKELLKKTNIISLVVTNCSKIFLQVKKF